MNQYDLPFSQKARSKFSIKIISILLFLLMVAISIFFFVSEMKDDFIMGLSLGLLSLVFGILFLYPFLFEKRLHIEMTSVYIKLTLPFKTVTANWDEIYYAEIYEYNNNISIGVYLERDRAKQNKRTISNNFNALYGAPAYSFSIPLTFFKDIDAEKLLLTIGEQITKDPIRHEVYIEDDEESPNSIIKAVLLSSLFCVISGIVYGFTIYKFEKNYVAIPILACYLIISSFDKYYLEKSFNLFIRFLVGAICLIQIPIGIIGSIIFSQSYRFTVSDIVNLTIEYFKYLVHNPLNQIVSIIVAIICFVFGALVGRTSKKKAP